MGPYSVQPGGHHFAVIGRIWGLAAGGWQKFSGAAVMHPLCPTACEPICELHVNWVLIRVLLASADGMSIQHDQSARPFCNPGCRLKLFSGAFAMSDLCALHNLRCNLQCLTSYSAQPAVPVPSEHREGHQAASVQPCSLRLRRGAAGLPLRSQRQLRARGKGGRCRGV